MIVTFKHDALAYDNDYRNIYNEWLEALRYTLSDAKAQLRSIAKRRRNSEI